MAERYGAMMRIAVADENIAVEAVHLGNTKYADAAEGLGRHGENLALSDISLKVGILVGLQAVEGDLAGDDVALQRSAGDVRLAAILKAAVHDQLILHGALRKAADRGVAAVEAHEYLVRAIGELALNGLFVHIGGNGVVDVEQGYGLAGDAGADELGQRAVDVNFAGYRNAHSGHAAVDVARNKAELRLECRPALVGHRHILGAAAVGFHPVEQGQLILCKARQDAGHFVAFAELIFHFLDLGGDAGIVCMRLVGGKQIQLAVFLNVDAELEQRGDRGVAGEEVERTGAEGDDLEILDRNQRAGNRNPLIDHVGYFRRGSHGELGDIGSDAVEL